MSYLSQHHPKRIIRCSLLALLTLILLWVMSLFLAISPSATSNTSTPASATLPCGWNLIDSPSPDLDSNSLLSAAAVASNDVWAVGHHGDQSLTEHWNGTGWSVVPVPSPSIADLADVAAIASSDVWAVGIHGDDYRLLTEHWDGSGWSVVPSPNRGSSNYFRGIAAVATDNVWAVGYYDKTSVSQTLIEHWDGQGWSIVPSPNANTNANALHDVAAVSANDIWAVGFYATPHARTLILHWDGIQWSIVPSPNPPGATVAGLESVAALS